MSHDLLEIAQRTLAEAIRLGARQVEVYVSSVRSLNLEVENNVINTVSQHSDAGVGVRVLVGKRMGYAYATDILESDAMQVAHDSVALARIALPDPALESLPSPSGGYPSVGGLYDRRIGDLTLEDATDMVLETVDAAREVLVHQDFAIEAHLTCASSSRAIVSSLGVEGVSSSTSILVSCSPTIRTHDDQTSSYDYELGRSLDSVSPAHVGANAAQNALEVLGARTVECGDMPLVLTPMAVESVLDPGLTEALNAEEVLFGRSFMGNAIGEEVASQELHVVDDALLPGGIGSRVFDGEGMPSQRTELISDGVLKSLLHNSYSAFKVGVPNTANASRISYRTPPGISSSNLVVIPGSGHIDDLVAEMSRGIVCRYTGDRPNPATGDLSALVMEGFYVEDGSIKHPIKNTLVGINMRDLLKRVVRIGSDVRMLSTVVTPSILIDSVRVTSG
ncbi:MAG: TldD/PmbA family protein [Candidatus Thorarchaeota archaeon]